MMTKYQKLGLIFGQIFMGFVFGFIGFITTAIIGTVYESITGNYINDLSTHILYSFYGSVIGFQIGIGIDGFKYLEENGLKSDFKRHFSQSLIGLFFGILIFYFYMNLFTTILPIVGAISGFNLGLIKKINERRIKNI
jgi:hypothetical protein